MNWFIESMPPESNYIYTLQVHMEIPQDRSQAGL